MRVTHTRTHVYVTFANPYLTCDECGVGVPRWHNPQQCGCDQDGWENMPCGHQAGATSVCASWGPVDGCQCQRLFKHVPHADLEGDRDE